MYDKEFKRDENKEHRDHHSSYGHASNREHRGSYGHGRSGGNHSYGHDSGEHHGGYGHGGSGARRGSYDHKDFEHRGGEKGRRPMPAYDAKNSPIKLGIIQKLYVQRFVEFGAYLGVTEEKVTKDEKETAPKGVILEVLLPRNELSEEVRTGEPLDVFVYLDSSDRPVATLSKPKLTLDSFAPLTVKELSNFGAFLDWGLPKDLFMPFGEMKEHPREGETVLVRLYIDKSGRLAASEKDIYKMLSTDSPYKKDDDVTGRVYELGVDFGIFVAVDDKYSAMIPKSEKHDELHIGDVINARVMDVKEDGKLDISLRDKAYVEIDNDAEALYQLLDEYGGVFPFTEKATPAVIERETGLSKAAFKRAIGRLYKERKITLNNGVIRKAVEE